MKVKETIGIIAGLIGIIAGSMAIKNNLKKDSILQINGNWILTFEIQKSNAQRYIDGELEYSYNVFFTQNGQIISGTGEKFKEIFYRKETQYTGKQKTPIKINGSISTNQLNANINEVGTSRESTGFIKFQSDDLVDGEATGTFGTSAGNSSGIATLSKIK